MSSIDFAEDWPAKVLSPVRIFELQWYMQLASDHWTFFLQTKHNFVLHLSTVNIHNYQLYIIIVIVSLFTPLKKIIRVYIYIKDVHLLFVLITINGTVYFQSTELDGKQKNSKIKLYVAILILFTFLIVSCIGVAVVSTMLYHEQNKHNNDGTYNVFLGSLFWFD